MRRQAWGISALRSNSSSPYAPMLKSTLLCRPNACSFISATLRTLPVSTDCRVPSLAAPIASSAACAPARARPRERVASVRSSSARSTVTSSRATVSRSGSTSCCRSTRAAIARSVRPL
ncbi:hypothetical protein ACFQ9X_16965 [Catenulispora yoronensis]